MQHSKLGVYVIFLLQAERRQVISLFRFSCFETLPALIFFYLYHYQGSDTHGAEDTCCILISGVFSDIWQLYVE